MGYVTDYQPIRAQYFLVRSVPDSHTNLDNTIKGSLPESKTLPNVVGLDNCVHELDSTVTELLREGGGYTQ